MSGYKELCFEVRNEMGRLQATFCRRWEAEKYAEVHKNYTVTKKIGGYGVTREEIIDFCDMKAQLEPENEDIFKAIIKALEDAISRSDIIERCQLVIDRGLSDKTGYHMVSVETIMDVINTNR